MLATCMAWLNLFQLEQSKLVCSRPKWPAAAARENDVSVLAHTGVAAIRRMVLERI